MTTATTRRVTLTYTVPTAEFDPLKFDDDATITHPRANAPYYLVVETGWYDIGNVKFDNGTELELDGDLFMNPHLFQIEFSEVS